MQLASVRLQGFRNLTCSINLCGPLSLIVGENNSGKSNLIDAIRLVLRALAYPSHQLWVTVEDFPHDGRGVQVADAFEIEAIFTDLSDRQLGRMVSCLAPSLGPNVARLRLRADRPSSGRHARRGLDGAAGWFRHGPHEPDTALAPR